MAKLDGLREIIAAAVSQGWKVEETRGNHMRLIPPDRNKRVVILGGTPSCTRARQNTIGELRRSGLKL